MNEGIDDIAWWELPTDDPSVTSTVHGVILELRNSDGLRRALYREWDDLYDGDGRYASTVDDTNIVRGLTGESTFNYAARALDMVHSKVTAEMPTVRAVGHGADYDQHIRAQGLSRFIVGMTEALGLQDQLPRAVLCALRVGTGVVVSGIRDGEPHVEVAHPREFLVDPDDAVHGDPRCLYRVSPVDRRSVLREFPDRGADIAAAGCISDRDGARTGRPGDWTAGSLTGRVSDCVDVIDAWVLGDGNEPGRHVRCLDNGAPLVDVTWTASRFPVAFLRAWEPTAGTGWWGHGLMEREAPAQRTVNGLWADVCNQVRYRRTIMWLPDTADISEGALTDQDPDGITVIRTSGKGEPRFENPSVLGPELMNLIASLKSDIYSMAGTDESAVGSQSPLGRDASGTAIRTYHDFQSQGHVDLMRRIGRFVVDVVDRTLDVAKSAFSSAKGQSDWEVRHPTLDVIRWADVDMDRDAYVLELQEVSPVPDTFAGALQELEEDAAAGRIAPEYMTRLREQPDRWWADRCNAKEDVEFVDWMVSELMDVRRRVPALPDEVVPTMLTDRLRREILSGIRLGRPPEVIERLRDMAGQVADAAAQAQQQVQAQAPGFGPGVPPAPTGAPPPPPVNG